MAEPAEQDVCEMAMRAAFKKGLQLCGTEESQLEQMKPLFGFETGDGEPDVDCEAALEEGLNQETLENINGTRQWVMCKAHRLTAGEDGLSFQDAVAEAWARVDRAQEE